mgnify:CR=1 FL=1
MIFDWIDNGIKINESKALSEKDGWDRKRKWTQEVNYVRYLKWEEEYSDEQCLESLSLLSNGTAAVYAYDPDEVLRRLNLIMAKAKRLGRLPRIPNVLICEDEVAYLDSLNAPLEIKRFWMGLLVYVKTKRVMYERATYDKGILRELMARAGLKGRYTDLSDRIERWSRRCGVPFPLSVSVKTPFYSVPRWLGQGEFVAECGLDDYCEAMALLDRKDFTCPECGRRFARPKCAKAFICPVCAEKKKVLDARERKRRQKKSR